MGSRSSTDTLVQIFLAFLRQKTWTQADLARACEIRVPAMRRRLEEMRAHGVPLECQEEHPHVYWSVPHGWFPGGVVLELEDVRDLLRIVSRSPAGALRSRALRRLLQALGSPGGRPDGAHVVPPNSPIEESFLSLVEDAAERRVPLRVRYYSVSRGAFEVRHVSVHRLVPGPPARIAGVCHKDDKLKWYRLESFASAALDEAETFRARTAAEVEAFVAASLGGFHAPEAATEQSFFVCDPDARWVERNLPGPMRVERLPAGTRFVVQTAGLPVLARFVVGLGQAARAETPELAEVVRELAQGALSAYGAPARAKANGGARQGRKVRAAAAAPRRARGR